MVNNQGVLYIATGEEYLHQAKLSAQTVRRHTDLPIAVVTDRSVENDCFDRVIVVDNPEDSFADKPKYIDRSPFDRTLYLDTDAFLIGNVSELLTMLENVDIATAIDPYEWELRVDQQRSFDDVPMSVPIYQTGVIAYKHTSRTKELFDTWYNIQENTDIKRDQASFRPALYRTELQFCSFSHQYNFLTKWPLHAVGEVKVLHDNSISDLEYLDTVAKRINDSSGIRMMYGFGNPYTIRNSGFDVYIPTSKVGNTISKTVSKILKFILKIKSVSILIYRSVQNHGVRITIKNILDYFN